jgi:cellulose synthase/poly-beta-1,6-N-acetylglucosamine synthase-like glycosyltransferase
MQRRLVGIAAVILGIFVGLFFLFPDRGMKLLAFTSAILAAAFYLLAIWRETRRDQDRRWRRVTSAYSLILFWILFLTLPVLYALSVLLATRLDASSLLFIVSLMGLTFTLFYDFINLPLALYHKQQEERRLRRPVTSFPKVTFLVPAHNEERCLERTLDSILQVDYSSYEVIVVDDGSSDRTYQLARRYASRGVRVVSRVNGGKAAALNLGLFFARGDIIVTVDADSLVSRDCLKELVKLFTDPRVMAVCGNVKVLNRVNLLTRLQALEYIVDINIAKRAFDVFGSTMVVPGVLGAFRREALESVGRYDPDTLTEDFDATLKILKAGSVVQATALAEAYTEAPETLKDLYRQRRRWYAGTLQTLFKHGDVVRNPRFGFLSGLGYPYLLISILFVPLAGLLALVSGVLAALTGQLLNFLQVLGLFILLELMFSLLAILMDGEDLRLLLLAPLFVIGYRQVRDLIRLEAMFEVMLRRRVGWTRASRVGRAKEMLVTEA